MAAAVIDYESPRGRLAAALIGYMRGQIDNFGLDDAASDVIRDDGSLTPVFLALWFTYDDCKRHSVSVDRRTWKGLRRMVAFLLSDEPMPPDRVLKVTPSSMWPFPTWAAVRRSVPTLASVPLPVYDPAVHGRPIRSKTESTALYLVWAAIAVALFSAGFALVRAVLG